MKKLFERMKSYSFWVSFSGALIIFLNCLGNIFNFKIQNEVVEDVIMSIAGLLVVLGFVSKETTSDEDTNSSTEEETPQQAIENESEKNDETLNEDKNEEISQADEETSQIETKEENDENNLQENSVEEDKNNE